MKALLEFIVAGLLVATIIAVLSIMHQPEAIDDDSWLNEPGIVSEAKRAEEICRLQQGRN